MEADPILARRVAAYFAAGAEKRVGFDGWVTLDIRRGPALHVSPRAWAAIEAAEEAALRAA